MSSYDSSTTTFTAVPVPTRAELIRTAIDEHLGGRMRDWVGSADLARLAGTTQLGTTDGSSTVDGSLHRTLLGQPTAHALVATAEPVLLARSERELARATERTRLGDAKGAATAAAEAETTLRSAISATATRLAVDERTVTVEAAGRAMARLGFQVASEATGERSQALWAIRGDRAVAVVVQDGGAIETDVVGCPGDTCEPLMHQFREAMAAEGVVLDLTARGPHGDSSGGSLVARARAADAASMAEGLVRQLEHPTRRRRSSSVTPTRRRLRNEETT